MNFQKRKKKKKKKKNIKKSKSIKTLQTTLRNITHRIQQKRIRFKIDNQKKIKIQKNVLLRYLKIILLDLLFLLYNFIKVMKLVKIYPT